MTETTIATPTPAPAAPATETPNVDAAITAIETAPPAAPAAAPEKEPTVDELAKLEPDEIARMLEAGTTAVATPPAAAPAAAPAAPAADHAAPPAEGDEGAPGDMIPRVRLNQEIQKRRDLEAQNAKLVEERAYLAGRADAAAAAPAAPAAPKEDPVEVITQNLQTLSRNFNEAQLKLAEEFDQGNLSAKEWKQKEQALIAANRRLETQFNNDLIEHRRAQSQPDPQKVVNVIQNHAGLKAKTQEIMDANPWMASLPARLQGPIQQEAEEILESQMITLSPNASLAEQLSYTYDLRLAMVDVAKRWGFGGGAAAAPAAPTAPAATTTQQATPEQIKSKLELSRTQPAIPNLAGSSLPTDAMAGIPLESMSVDQIASLDPKVLAALTEREGRGGKAA